MSRQNQYDIFLNELPYDYLMSREDVRRFLVDKGKRPRDNTFEQFYDRYKHEYYLRQQMSGQPVPAVQYVPMPTPRWQILVPPPSQPVMMPWKDYVIPQEFYESEHPIAVGRLHNDMAQKHYTVGLPGRDSNAFLKYYKDKYLARYRVNKAVKTTEMAAYKDPWRKERYRFPIKKNIKQYCTHKIGPKGAYLIDIMFSKPFAYLVVINVNTRYLIVRLLSRFQLDEDRIKYKDTKAINDAMDDIIEEANRTGNPIKYLQGDGELAFKQIGIKFVPCQRQPPTAGSDGNSAPYHPQLAIIDRAIRTLRDMHFNMYGYQIIRPDEMKRLVYEYNKHYHSTLSKWGGRKLSPLDVQVDDELEQNIVYLINLQNMHIMSQRGFWLEVGQKVKLYNNKDPMAKYRSTTMPGNWVVQDIKGMFYLVRNQDDPREKYWVTRHRLDPV